MELGPVASFRDMLAQRRAVLNASCAFIILMIFSNIVEEHIYTKLPGFNYYWTVALAELAVFAGISLGVSGLASHPARRQAPLSVYFGMGVSMALSTSFGKLSNRHLNFASGTVVKCSKLLPTMLVGRIFLRKSYSSLEICAAALATLSAVLFSLGSAQVDIHFSGYGLVYSLLHLGFQALQCSLQDEAVRGRGDTVDTAMLWANALGFVVVLGIVVVTGEIVAATLFFAAQPEAVVLLAVRSLSFYAGARAFVIIIKEAGAVAAVAVGLVRKVLTIVLSFIFFPKPFSPNYVVGGFLLAAAFYLELHTQSQRRG